MKESRQGKHSLPCSRKSYSQSKEKLNWIFFSKRYRVSLTPHLVPERLLSYETPFFFFHLIFILETNGYFSVPHWRLLSKECRHLNGMEYPWLLLWTFFFKENSINSYRKGCFFKLRPALVLQSLYIGWWHFSYAICVIVFKSTDFFLP